MTDILKPLSIESVNQFLLNKLNNLIANAEIDLSMVAQSGIQFNSENKRLHHEICYITDNIILYGTSKKLEKPAVLSQTAAELTKYLAKVIKQIMKIDDAHQTLTIDTQNEGFYPDSDQNAWIFSKLAGCNICYRDGRLIDYDEAHDNRLTSFVKISLAPALLSHASTTKGIQLKYRRSFLNKQLRAQDEIDLVLRLEKEKELQFNQLDIETQATVVKLIDKKVITIIYPVFNKNTHLENALPA